MATLQKNASVIILVLSSLLPAGSFAQTEVSVAFGLVKNLADMNEITMRGTSGQVKANHGFPDPCAGIQAVFPLADKLQLQTGIRAMYKTYEYELRFEYPDKFALINRWTTWGTAIEVPVHVLYTIPKPVWKRTLKVSAGFAIGHNRIYELSDSRRTEIYAPAPNTLSHRFETEFYARRKLFTPALEASFEYGPLLHKSLSLRGTFHYDLLPAFGSVEYLNYYRFETNEKSVQGYPEGMLRADDTGYCMLQLNYKLPFWPKKKKAA